MSSIVYMRRGLASAAVLVWLALALAARASLAAGAEAEPELAAAAKRIFWDTKGQHQKQPANTEAAWHFARACFDLAEFATNSAERAQIAEQGIAACRQVIARDPNSAPGHYYLGMNLAQLAQTKGLSALKI